MRSAVESWSRKLHIYLGLYFLFFLWLFCLSGVVLNHPKWRIAEFWNERKQTSSELQISRPAETDDFLAARNLMTQLKLRGEISGKIVRGEAGEFDFRVIRPGYIYEVKADFGRGQARIHQTSVNGWGVLNMLHSFTGVRRSDPSQQQNWWPTGIWRFSMDALSVGLIVMVLTGVYIWYSRDQRRRGGMLALALGFLTLALFISGIF
jgi:hypothetical protein